MMNVYTPHTGKNTCIIMYTLPKKVFIPHMQAFTPGAMVLLKNSARDTKKGDKMKPRWLGPYN